MRNSAALVYNLQVSLHCTRWHELCDDGRFISPKTNASEWMEVNLHFQRAKLSFDKISGVPSFARSRGREFQPLRLNLHQQRNRGLYKLKCRIFKELNTFIGYQKMEIYYSSLYRTHAFLILLLFLCQFLCKFYRLFDDGIHTLVPIFWGYLHLYI